MVALRKESVDRNAYGVMPVSLQVMSLSARRAWIEIHTILGGYYNVASVALRKESVDRNITSMLLKFCKLVALRKESVDRNTITAGG